MDITHQEHSKIVSIFSAYKALTIVAYLYFLLKTPRDFSHITIVVIAIFLVFAKIWFVDKPFLHNRQHLVKITKTAIIFLVIADINLVMIIPAIFDLIKDVIVAGLVQDPGTKQHYGTYGIVANHSVGFFSSFVIVLYVVEQQLMKYINFGR